MVKSDLKHKSQDLINDLEEMIAKIEKKQDKIEKNQKINVPNALNSLEIDKIKKTDEPFATFSEANDDGYEKMLIETLRHSLHLPDYGEVKIQLTLNKDGSVVNLVVVKAQSEKNKFYLENNLMHLRFPSLQETPDNKKQRTFLLVFCNE